MKHLPSRLKHETRTVHQRLETRLPILHDTFTKRDYISLLLRFHGFYVPFEDRMLASRFSALLEDRRKVPALRKDIGALGVDMRELKNVPFAPVDAFERAEDCWGALYVLEGSTLGGQIIARHLAARFGLDSDNGLSFFSGHGSATTPRWKSFLSAMESAHGRCNLDEERTVQSAVRTFETLEAWLVEPLVSRCSEEKWIQTT